MPDYRTTFFHKVLFTIKDPNGKEVSITAKVNDAVGESIIGFTAEALESMPALEQEHVLAALIGKKYLIGLKASKSLQYNSVELTASYACMLSLL